MNSQRNVIYTRRRHALMGERIGLDVLNTIYDTSTAIADQHAEDFEGFKLELFKTFAMESPFTEDEFKSMKPEQLVEKLFEDALKTYNASRSPGHQASVRESRSDVREHHDSYHGWQAHV